MLSGFPWEVGVRAWWVAFIFAGVACSRTPIGAAAEEAVLAVAGVQPLATDPTGGVTWSILENAAGGAITTAGVYTAPLTGGVYHVVARSNANAAVSASAPVTVVGIAVSPSPAAVDSCRSLAMTGTVTGPADTAIVWTVEEGAAGGAITAGGVYTAPSTAGAYHIVATSHFDSAVSVITPVTVSDRVVSVEVNPPQPTIELSATAQFTATVTTTCGAFTATKILGPNGVLE